MTHDPNSSPAADDNAEPEITQEESVPSDGTDKVGEEMMEELGRERRKDAKEKAGPKPD